MFEGGRYVQRLVRPSSLTRQATMSDLSPLIYQWILLRTLAGRRYRATVKEIEGWREAVAAAAHDAAFLDQTHQK
jgi:hypothetical protein